MKILLMNVLLALVCPPLSGSPVPRAGFREDSAGEEAIIKSEKSLWNSYSIHDVQRLNFLLAEDLTFTKENGFCTTKAQELSTQQKLWEKGIGKDSVASEALDYIVQKVRLFDHTAVTNGYFVEKDENGKAFRFYFTNTWVERNGHWQVVAIQITEASAAVLAKAAAK